MLNIWVVFVHGMGTGILILHIIKKENLTTKCNLGIQFQFYVYAIYLKNTQQKQFTKIEEKS